MSKLVRQLVTHPLTEHKLEMFAESTSLIEEWTNPFLDADAIIGAQFYYSNPLLFIPVTGDMKRHACMYGNLYLLNIEDWGLINPAHPVFAINQLYIEKIESVTDFYEHDPDKLFGYHIAQGLYLIGIHEDSK